MQTYVSIIEILETSEDLLQTLASAAQNLSGILAQAGERHLVFEFNCNSKAISFSTAINDFYPPARFAYAYNYIK